MVERESISTEIVEGYWSAVADSEEMKSFIKKEYKFDYKNLAYLLIFFVAAIWMFLSGKEESSSMAHFLPGLTDKAGKSVLMIVACIVVYLVTMYLSKGNKCTYQEGTITSITVGSASNPETKGMLIGGRIPRYDIRMEETKSKRIRIMDTTNKEFAYTYKPGMKVRYHEAFDFIEKYDKSKDEVLYCPHCKRKNSLDNTNCFYCNCPLLK